MANLEAVTVVSGPVTVKVKIDLNPDVTPGAQAPTRLREMAADMRTKAANATNPLVAQIAEAVGLALDGLATRVEIRLGL